MNSDPLAQSQGGVRGTDTNSLLRLYDRARALLAGAASQLGRQQAVRAAQRIAQELRRRGVTVEPIPGPAPHAAAPPL